jgi:hypothetical protein
MRHDEVLRLMPCRSQAMAQRILGEAANGEPEVSETVERAEPQGFAKITFGLLGPAKMRQMEPHKPMGAGQIGIELERVHGFDRRPFSPLGDVDELRVDAHPFAALLKMLPLSA